MTINKRILLILAITSYNLAGAADDRISRSQYIETWKTEAISQMVTYRIPASITLAQGILESGDGNSRLAKQGNNHFGIKCHTWTGKTIHKDDDKKNECFRKYESARESFQDHSEFLTKRGRYSFLFDLEPNDYKGWAKGLKTAGYATNPKYSNLLIALIEKNNLQQYDNMVMPSKNHSNSSDGFLFAGLSKPKTSKHSIYIHNNNIKYIKVKSKDTFYKISKEFGIHLGQIYKYNDLSDKNFIKEGDIIYLQPKRKKAKVESHKVKKNETLQVISQLYGVRLKSICKKNNLEAETILQIGQILELR
jgi:LysM repeat protein